MKWTSWMLVLAALMAPGAAAKATPAAQTDPGPVVGGYRSLDLESPSALEARAAIQKYFVSLRLGAIQEAYLQVVAGTNIKLVCLVDGEERPAAWEFVVWHRLDDRWELTSARKL